MKTDSQYIRKKKYMENLSGIELFSEVNEKLLIQNTEDTHANVCFGVLAPVLNRFVIWVLQKALEHKVRRLYFLARDAYFMYLAAGKYVQRYNLPIECRYLYCSRYALRIPLYHRNQEKALDYITLGGLDITARKLYARAGITGRDQDKLLDSRIIDYDADEQIPRSDLASVRRKLRESTLFIDMMNDISLKAEPGLKGYLLSQELISDDKAAFVDSGWMGSLQKDLNEALEGLGRKEYMEGYYYGLYEIPLSRETNRYHAYHFSPDKGLKRKVLFNNCLFETIFTAPHGMTLGYRQEQEKIYKPVLGSISENRIRDVKNTEKLLTKWQDALLETGNIRSFDELCQSMLDRDTEKAINRNQALFMHWPSLQEAKIYGELEFTDDILEYGGNQIATVLTGQELKDNTLSGRLAAEFLHHKYVKQSGWYEGSAVLFSEADGEEEKSAKKYIRGYSRYKRVMYIRKGSLYKCRQRCKKKYNLEAIQTDERQ